MSIKKIKFFNLGFTEEGDIKNAAIGIDEWVKADGGNSYILRNYEWINVEDSGGATQLIVYFDTMLCE